MGLNSDGETKILQLFTKQKQQRSLGRILLAFIAASMMLTSGCGVKRTVKIEPPPNTNLDKTATFYELTDLMRNYDAIHTLVSNSITVTLTTGRIESGRLERYRSAPGYILLKRPDSVRLVLQAPVTKTSILNLTSVGDDFNLWLPTENRYFFGINSARELHAANAPDIEEIPPIRATHIFEAVFPQALLPVAPGEFISSVEAADENTRYYVLSVHRMASPPRAHTIRKIWIERFGMTIARQQIYLEDGRIESDIAYSNAILEDGFALPDKIHIDRPLDDYSLDILFKNWSVNPNLPEDAFSMPPPPKAEIIYLKEKGRSKAS